MTEHPGDHGMDVPGVGERADAYEPELPDGHGGEPAGAQHELGTASTGHVGDVGHEHVDPLPDDLAAHAETAAAHGHHPDRDDIEASESHEYAPTPAAIALAAPGGTVFDVVAAPEPAWIAAHDHATALTAGASTRYAASWSAEDGTGLTGALFAGHDGHDDDMRVEPDRLVAGTIPAHADVLVYGGAGGVSELAARLWGELAPGTEPPLSPDGEPLAGQALLNALSLQLHDPVARSVVDAARAFGRDEATGW